MHKNIKKDINEIKKITAKMPKSVNEALNFNGLGEDNEEILMDEEEPVEKPEPMEKEEGTNIDGFIANMRKESLAIMRKLYDKPDDPVYQFAKKIFQLADKAHEDQKEGKDINGQPKQGMNPNENIQNSI